MERFRVHGDPLADVPIGPSHVKVTAADKLAASAVRPADGSGCLAHPKGHRHMFMVDGARMYAARAAFHVWVRPVVDGEYIVHTCDTTWTPWCIEPTHLEAVDRSEFYARMRLNRNGS